MKRIISILLAAALLVSTALFPGCAAQEQTATPVDSTPVSDTISDDTADDTADDAPVSTAPVDSSISAGHPCLEGRDSYPKSQALREEISTVDEAAKYLDGRFPELWMSLHLNNGQDDINWLRSGAEILEDEELNAAGRSCIASAASYLLGDDMDISALVCFWYDGMAGGPMKAINCIKTDAGYEFVDIAKMLSGDEMSRFGSLLPEGTYPSVEEYVDTLCADPELGPNIYSLHLFRNGEKFIFRMREDGWVTMLTPDNSEIYVNESLHVSDEELEEKLYGHIKPENIGSYQLSTVLGGITLTAEEAYALVDASPEQAKEKIKTAGDVLMYMLAARVGDCGGCRCDEWDGHIWHTNFTAKEVMEYRLSNCGASANLANYMLEGDYDEVGFILHAYYPGNGGGHVYNYILHEGKYYIVDLSWYIFAGYDVNNDFPVMVLDSLEEYGQRVHDLYGGVCLVIAHTSTGQHLPNIFGDDFGDVHYFVPEGAEYSVLYESGDGYLIGEMPLDKKYHDWNMYW